MGNWRFGINSNGRKYRKTGRRVERKLAEGKEEGGFCGGVDGNSRERVKVFGREARSCSRKGVVILEKRGTISHKVLVRELCSISYKLLDVLTLVFRS
jgi:hypothetical protein